MSELLSDSFNLLLDPEGRAYWAYREVGMKKINERKRPRFVQLTRDSN